MFILYILFTLICCFVTYKFSCYQIMKLDKINNKGYENHTNFICKALDEIASIKTDVNKIKKDIYQ